MFKNLKQNVKVQYQVFVTDQFELQFSPFCCTALLFPPTKRDWGPWASQSLTWWQGNSSYFFNLEPTASVVFFRKYLTLQCVYICKVPHILLEISDDYLQIITINMKYFNHVICLHDFKALK